MEDIVGTIKKYYRSNHIRPANYREFECPHKKSCRDGCERFATGNEPMIGSKYEKRLWPRLLIISAEAAHDSTDWRGRTVEGHRGWWEDVEKEKITNWANKVKGSIQPKSHWFKTNQMAMFVFEVFNNRKLSGWILRDIKKLRGWVKSSTYQPVAPYWAHTNSGKCSQNRDNHEQATDVLFENCRKYLPREICILKPDIIVTQGAKALMNVQEAISRREIKAKEAISYQLGSCNYLALHGHPVLWIIMPHPNRRIVYYEVIKAANLRYWGHQIIAFLNESGWAHRTAKTGA